MKLIKLSSIIIGIILMTGCKKYLSEEPAKQASIQTVSQLEALLNSVADFTNENNFTASFSTDDTEISKELVQKNPGRLNADIPKFYTFQINAVAERVKDDLWLNEYKKIFSANLILANIDQVTGDDGIKARVKADAYFIRAYSHWVLVNYYCAPYSASNMGGLGLPLKKTTSYEESLKRSTLKETYDFILADIAEAKKTAPDEVDPRGTWRISQKAISAFLSRFYLFTGDYDKSLEEAGKALTSATRSLVDYNTLLPGISRSFSNPAATLKYVELNDWSAVKYLYWQETYYARFHYNLFLVYIPSSGLRAIYDAQNDLRYKNLMIPNGYRANGIIDPSTFLYTMFNSGRYILSGPTVAEVLLNKAEALARKGDAPGAMTAVNTLRQKRMNSYVALTASGTDDAIAKVLQERRREMPFAMRWYDIRRFSVNNYPADDITVTRDFYAASNTGAIDLNTPKTYTLEPKRYLVPITNVEITASRGEIVQNPY